MIEKIYILAFALTPVAKPHPDLGQPHLHPLPPTSGVRPPSGYAAVLSWLYDDYNPIRGDRKLVNTGAAGPSAP